MSDYSPITPPLALIDQWWKEAKQNAKYDEPIGPLVATQAAQWGANQELEACCELVPGLTSYLRAARRPKPPSLKEQALADLDSMSIEPCQINGIDTNALVRAKYDNIRRALEQLPN